MSANIIQLPNAKRSRIKCQETGVIFPQVYRLTGFGMKFKEGKGPTKHGFIENDDDMEPDLASPILPSYTLDTERVYATLGHPKWEPISHLDPTIDEGYVYVRHHENLDAMEGYIDALYDTETYDIEDNFLSFNTDFGCFTILHRKANREAVSHALVYRTKIADSIGGGTLDWSKVIGPGGEELDMDNLSPPEIIERYAPLKALTDRLATEK